MNTMRDPDAIISAWLDEGPTDLPEDTRHAIVVGTRAIRQRRPTGLPWRHDPMSPTSRFAAIAALAAVAIVALVMLIPRSNPGVGGPGAGATLSATPSASPTSIANPSPSPIASAQPSSAGVIALPEAGQWVFPGTYTTHFQPPLTLTVGRQVESDCVPGTDCRGDVNVNAQGWLNLEFGNAPGYEVSIGRIDKVLDPKHAGKLIDPPKDLAGWISTLPGVTVIAPPKTVKIGGLDGTRLDIQSGNKVVDFGPIPGSASPANFGMGPHDLARLIAVDVAGHQVLVRVDVIGPGTPGFVADPAQFQAATDALQPLIDSIAWH